MMLRVSFLMSCKRHSAISRRQCLTGSIKARILDLQQVLDDVLAERLAGVQFALAQILDFLGDQVVVEAVGRRRAAAQQFRLLLRPGIEILVVERAVRFGHA